MSQPDRRTFLRRAAALSSMGVAGPLGLNLSAITEAAAQSAGSGYRALVCIFLHGGNDAFNTVLATDSTSWQHYRNHRDPSARNGDGESIALLAAASSANPSVSADDPRRLGGVLPIAHAGRAVHTGRQFALHPSLKQTQQLYAAGRLAVLANVGPLTRPTAKADMSDVRMSKPAKLFSHNDQQSTWLSFKPEGSNPGWGGRMGDLLARSPLQGVAADSDEAVALKSFTCMTPGNESGWFGSLSLQPYQSGSTRIQELGQNSRIYGSTQLNAAVVSLMSATTSNNKFVNEHQRIVQRGLRAGSLIGSKLPALGLAPWSSPGVTTPSADPKLMYTSAIDGTPKFNALAVQLQMVARLIEANRNQPSGLKMSRQLFIVNLGGFDTHDRLIRDHGERMAQLDHALAYFDAVLGGMPGGNARDQVTTFTASEFGRTFTSNGDGSDHGWGGHHFIMGGAVRGTEVYGTFPQYSTADGQGKFSSPDQLDNGVLLPSTSVDHYAYTLGRWMGLSGSELLGILPNLGQFPSGGHDLGFLNA
ncbi:MAG: DUF1501 domain-containing protein [Aquabacterium sp.]